MQDDNKVGRQPGPAPALTVRRFGDAALAELLAEALAATGRAERATHAFHTYPANMHPDAARALIASSPGPVFDPFCGGGTVLVEAMLAGRPTAGADLSPIAVLVARARTAGPAAATPLRAASRRVMEKARANRELAAVPEICVAWYEPHVAQEIAHIRDAILAEPADVQPLLNAVLSSILIKVSLRESDTRNTKKAERRRPGGTTLVLFHKKARELGRALEDLPAGAAVHVRKADAIKVAPPRDTGLLLTSPPYPGVFDYLPMQQLRYAWLNMDPGSSLAAEVGSRRTFRAEGRARGSEIWKQQTDRWVATQAGGLSSGARMGIVVGDGFVGDRLVDALYPTVEAMKASGLHILARASADRVDHARQVIRIEHFVLGEKK